MCVTLLREALVYFKEIIKLLRRFKEIWNIHPGFKEIIKVLRKSGTFIKLLRRFKEIWNIHPAFKVF